MTMINMLNHVNGETYSSSNQLQHKIAQQLHNKKGSRVIKLRHLWILTKNAGSVHGTIGNHCNKLRVILWWYYNIKNATNLHCVCHEPKLNKAQFFPWTEFFSSGRQAFARSHHGFLRSEEDVNLNKFQHLGCMGVILSCSFYGHCGKWWPHCNGRCCSYCIMLADVIPWICGRCYYYFCWCAKWQMKSYHGRCYSLVYSASIRCYCQRDRWNSYVRVDFILSSEVLNRISSHMWGRWYLPMLMFRDGLLTLMYNASFIFIFHLPPVTITSVTSSIHKAITPDICSCFPFAIQHNNTSGNNICHKSKA